MHRKNKRRADDVAFHQPLRAFFLGERSRRDGDLDRFCCQCLDAPAAAEAGHDANASRGVRRRERTAQDLFCAMGEDRDKIRASPTGTFWSVLLHGALVSVTSAHAGGPGGGERL